MREWIPAFAGMTVRIMSDIETLEAGYLAEIESAADVNVLEDIRVRALGKKGEISALLKTLGKMTPEERQTEGPKINGARETVANAIAARKTAMEDALLDEKLAAEAIDLTLPAPEAPQGSVHPVAQVMDELAEIFAGPEPTRESLGPRRGAASQVGACWRFFRSFQEAGVASL